MSAGSWKRIIECPMLDIALATLHEHATDTRVPRGFEGLNLLVGEMKVAVRHDQIAADTVEAHFSIAAFEGEGV